MSPNVFTVDQLRSDILRHSMALLATGKKLPPGYDAVNIEPDFGMLVEPTNGAPYVFLLPNVVHEFVYQAGSGTDKLRQRMLAGIFFSDLVEAHQDKQRREQQAGQAQVAADAGVSATPLPTPDDRSTSAGKSRPRP